MTRYQSTLDMKRQVPLQPEVAFPEALFRGQAPDGGLYAPTTFPSLRLDDLTDADFATRACAVMRAWLDGDVDSRVTDELCRQAFDFPVPLTRLDEQTFLLELFHGPTAAFKDFGARFMARAMARLRPGGRQLTILVATSGDTGSAVAHAFGGLEGATVVLLYPAGKVSPLQEAQLTAVPSNVRSLRVGGTFDDCQAMVKAAFRNANLVRTLGLTSANSINIGRLLPQSTYYVHASLEIVRGLQADSTHAEPFVVVPSGNLGNLTAGLYAKTCGAPIRRFVAASNRNDVFPRFLETGVLTAQPTLHTPSNAMDVGDPSNAARIVALYGDATEAMRADLLGASIDDETTLSTIRDTYRTTGRFVCPHTAVGLAALAHARRASRRGARPAIVLSTAHAGKFAEIVREATGEDVPLPAALGAALRNRRPAHDLEARPEALHDYLQQLD